MPSTERQLRDRIAELEEELRQERDRIRPKAMLPYEWKLEPAQQRLILALYAAPHGRLSHEQLYNVVRVYSEEASPANVVGQQVLRARRKLKHMGFQITARWGEGYELPPTSREMVRKALYLPSEQVSAA